LDLLPLLQFFSGSGVTEAQRVWQKKFRVCGVDLFWLLRSAAKQAYLMPKKEWSNFE
jgi:hypothetical protein